METLSAKLLAVTTIISGTAISGIGIQKLIEPSNVKEALISKGKTVLDTESKRDDDSSNKAEWTKIVSKKELRKGLKGFLGIKEKKVPDWNSKIDALRDECSKKLSIEKGSESFSSALSDAEKYCVQIDNETYN